MVPAQHVANLIFISWAIWAAIKRYKLSKIDGIWCHEKKEL